MHPVGWISHPDDVENLVDDWRRRHAEVLQVDEVRQYAGRRVFALTVRAAKPGQAAKPALLFHKPHAHEPAPCAAIMNVLAKLLDGSGLDGSPPPLPPEAILDAATLTFLPDANPGGTERAPVLWWDGTQYTNEEFWVWMRGLHPQTGRMWERFDKWDMREVDPRPATIGIVYEQVSEHEWVEPNRHHDSSLFKLIFRLSAQYDYRLFVSLHQTEFAGQLHDCMAILPITYDDQPDFIREREMEVASNVVRWWREWGGNPVPDIKPLGYRGTQADYLRAAWSSLYARIPAVTSEVRNNSLLCPPSKQRALCEAAIWAAIETAMRWTA